VSCVTKALESMESTVGAYRQIDATPRPALKYRPAQGGKSNVCMLVTGNAVQAVPACTEFQAFCAKLSCTGATHMMHPRFGETAKNSSKSTIRQLQVALYYDTVGILL